MPNASTEVLSLGESCTLAESRIGALLPGNIALVSLFFLTDSLGTAHYILIFTISHLLKASDLLASAPTKIHRGKIFIKYQWTKVHFSHFVVSVSVCMHARTHIPLFRARFTSLILPFYKRR